MPRRPGTLALLPDGRKAVIYNDQPLLKSHGKIVVHLMGDDYNLIVENGKEKTLLFDVDKYTEIIKTWKGIGKVD